MKKTASPAPEQTSSPAPENKPLPMDITVRINNLRTEGSILANASVNLNGCFAIRGIKVINGSDGPFVSMPSYKSGSEYRDICFPCTKEFHQQFHQAVLNAYEQALTQLPQRSQQSGQEQEAPAPVMKM